MKPPTERQQAILVYLLEQSEETPSVRYLHYPCPPSAIAYGIGMDKLPLITAYKGWSGTAVMNPAQRIISSLGGLEKRELIQSAPRPDGMSGSAYRLTEAGTREAQLLRGALS